MDYIQKEVSQSLLCKLFIKLKNLFEHFNILIDAKIEESLP